MCTWLQLKAESALALIEELSEPATCSTAGKHLESHRNSVIAATIAGVQASDHTLVPSLRHFAPRAHSKPSAYMSRQAWTGANHNQGHAHTHLCIVHRATSRVKLSSLLSQLPSAFDSRKVSVVDKRLTEIDVLPRHFHQAQVSKTMCCFCAPVPVSLPCCLFTWQQLWVQTAPAASMV